LNTENSPKETPNHPLRNSQTAKIFGKPSVVTISNAKLLKSDITSPRNLDYNKVVQQNNFTSPELDKHFFNINRELSPNSSQSSGKMGLEINLKAEAKIKLVQKNNS